jgi:hypothetical protein
VRDHLLTAATARLIAENRFSKDLWEEPFYASLIGAALAKLPDTAIQNANNHNPPALFAGLQDSSLDEKRAGLLLNAAKAWTQTPAFNAEENEQKRHHAMRFLARIDAGFVPDLANRFPYSFPQIEALVRNGSARAGAARCASSGPGTQDGWRDRMIAHALARHPNFVSDLADLICDQAISEKLLEGALNLAGELGDPKICDALSKRWALGDGKTLTAGWLWAALRCCPPIDHPLAKVLCDIWAQLPTKVRRGDNKHDSNPRWDIAGHSLPWGFRRKPETSAIGFLISRARSDRRLEHVLSSILMRVDHPDAIIYSVQKGAQIYRRTEKSGGFNLFASHLADEWSDWRGSKLSDVSRNALAKIWRNRRKSRFERKTAFLVWKQRPTAQDVEDITVLENDPILADLALKCRLGAGDQSAVPLLKERIWNTEQGHYWWYDARGVGLTGLHEDINRYLDQRQTDKLCEGERGDADHLIAELLMDEGDEFSVQIIIEHWDQLKTSSNFVQAALYLAHPETVRLAHSEIAQSEEPEKLLEFIDSHWGVKTYGRRGVTDIKQLVTLEPILATISTMKHGEMDIVHFFEVANDIGALEWRKTHLDPLLRTDRQCLPSDKNALFASLDNEVEIHSRYKRDWFGIDHWLERREKELWNRQELLKIVAEWALARGSIDATALLCEAMLNFAERRDLCLLDQLSPEMSEACAAKIANCIYDVKRRSLDA